MSDVPCPRCNTFLICKAECAYTCPSCGYVYSLPTERMHELNDAIAAVTANETDPNDSFVSYLLYLATLTSTWNDEADQPEDMYFTSVPTWTKPIDLLVWAHWDTRRAELAETDREAA